MLALPPTAFGHPDDHEIGLDEMRALLAGDATSYALHKRLVRKDGEPIVAEIQISVVRDAGDAPLYTLAQIQDVTARRADEHALRSSEERYRTIVETTSEGVWMLDADHRTTYVNPRMARMLGYEVEEMLGRPVLEFTPADRRVAVRERIQSRRAGVADQREELLCHKDGSDVWVLLSGSPMTDRRGGYAGALAMMADITERKRAEARAAQLAGIVEASPDVIVSLSLDGVIETFNAAAERHSGWTAAEVVGQPVTLMVPPENAGSIPGVLAKVAGGRTIERLRVDLVDKRGEREEASLSAAPIPGPDGAVAGIACLIRATSDG
jgi:PAS domain S-box-containing protein